MNLNSFSWLKINYRSISLVVILAVIIALCLAIFLSVYLNGLMRLSEKSYYVSDNNLPKEEMSKCQAQITPLSFEELEENYKPFYDPSLEIPKPEYREWAGPLTKGSFMNPPSVSTYINPTYSIKVDLNGDGLEDQISLHRLPFKETLPNCTILISGKWFLKINEVYTEIDEYFHPDGFLVVDLDLKDKFKEVALHDPGPSNDDVFLFFWYDGKQIKRMGKVARWPYLRGNGYLSVYDWIGFWGREKKYVLEPRTRILMFLPQEFYDVGLSGKAGCYPIWLYENPDSSSPVVAEIAYEDDVVIEKAYFAKTHLSEECEEESGYYCAIWYFVSAQNKSKKGWTKGEEIFYCLGIVPAD